VVELISIVAGIGITSAAFIAYQIGYSHGFRNGRAAGYHSGAADMRNRVERSIAILRAEFLARELSAGPEFADMLQTIMRTVKP